MTWGTLNSLICLARNCPTPHSPTQARLRWGAFRYSLKASSARRHGEEGGLYVGHSHFLSKASPGERWKAGTSSLDKEEEPSVDELEGISEGRGKLLPTSTHLFKLILPLGGLSHPGNTYQAPKKSSAYNLVESKVPPTVMLLHPSQPLSHVGSLIRASLSPATPIVSFRSRSSSGQAFQWSDSTDVGDFIRDAAHSAQFSVCLTYQPTKNLADTILKQDENKTVELNRDGGTKDENQLDPLETVIEVQVPTFVDRTRYLRRKLKSVERQIASMEDLKLICDKEAHRGARRMAVSGFGMLVVYWAGVARLTFWDYGWDVMEPITYLSGLSTVILGYLWFLYQGREVSYSSVLAQSISRRRDTLYKSHGFDIERWVELVGERKSLQKEIGRIAEDYEERAVNDAEGRATEELDEDKAGRTRKSGEDVVKDSHAEADEPEVRRKQVAGKRSSMEGNKAE